MLGFGSLYAKIVDSYAAPAAIQVVRSRAAAIAFVLEQIFDPAVRQAGIQCGDRNQLRFVTTVNLDHFPETVPFNDNPESPALEKVMTIDVSGGSFCDLDPISIGVVPQVARRPKPREFVQETIDARECLNRLNTKSHLFSFWDIRPSESVRT